MIALTLALIMAADMSPAQLKAKHLELGKQSTLLSKQGKYAEAAELLENFEKQVKAVQAQFDAAKFLAEGIAILRQRAAWAAKASTDFQSAQSTASVMRPSMMIV